MPTAPLPRRDWNERTPPFHLTAANLDRLAEVEAMCRRYRTDPSASIALELELMHRKHCYSHRPILGLANSLTVLGDAAFDADWSAHREQHMAEAYADYQRATAVDLKVAA
ncbi:hypothetical protein ACQEPB_00330 [Novosphingobium fluoreni]|uniref:hypothetical protein n=1 Tax=Novosphingobium fluoreni TaxID=1391222 RepID=UPI003DA1C2F6